jgi:hypothetical protein
VCQRPKPASKCWPRCAPSWHAPRPAGANSNGGCCDRLSSRAQRDGEPTSAVDARPLRYTEASNSNWRIAMTTASAGRSTANQRRALTALGIVAAAAVGVGTSVVGAHLIGVSGPASDTSPYLPAAYRCLQPVANPLAANGSEPGAALPPAMWKPGMPCGPVFSWNTATPSDSMLVPVDASSRPYPI